MLYHNDGHFRRTLELALQKNEADTRVAPWILASLGAIVRNTTRISWIGSKKVAAGNGATICAQIDTISKSNPFPQIFYDCNNSTAAHRREQPITDIVHYHYDHRVDGTIFPYCCCTQASPALLANRDAAWARTWRSDTRYTIRSCSG